MASIFDVADYILEQLGFVSTMKLQKLAFYSQAYSLVHDGRPLFDEDFEAWANGPVCRCLFSAHRGKFVVGPGELRRAGSFSQDSLDEKAKRAISHVLDALGSLSGRELSWITHSELPWRQARAGYSDGDRCDVPITKDAMRDFYASPQCSNPVFSRS